MTGVSRPPRGHRRRSDSDSEDELTSDHTSGPDYDSAGDRDEINDKILQALERLHQDMKSVISRLNTIEGAVLSQQVCCTNLLIDYPPIQVQNSLNNHSKKRVTFLFFFLKKRMLMHNKFYM